jgi:N-acetylneuraminic acid mutarotase
VPCNAPRTCTTTACQDGWITTTTPPGGLSPREKAAYVSIGDQLFIWGGVNESGTALNSGALYDPRDDRWTLVPIDADTPTPRSLATAVWTGSVIIVWGGLDPVNMEPLSDGAVFDPVANAWSPMTPGPTARAAAVGAVVSGNVVFFGGQGASSTPLGGLDQYDISMDSWIPAEQDSPPAVADPSAAGGTLTFWTHGGRTEMNTGVSDSSYYSMSTDRWVESEPLWPGRWGAFSAFTDSFFVWGGRDLSDLFGDGATHTPGGFDWDEIESRGAPSARFTTDRESGWTFVMAPETSDVRIVIIAGLDAPSSYLRDGAIYNEAEDNWSGISNWPTMASHAWGAAGVAAGEIIVWGGRDGTAITNQGVRYRPPD